MRCQFLNIF